MSVTPGGDSSLVASTQRDAPRRLPCDHTFGASRLVAAALLTVFIGDVGRPDLLASVGVTAELGRQLYHSLRDKLLTLPDATKVYPAHGAGSACGQEPVRVGTAMMTLPRAWPSWT